VEPGIYMMSPKFIENPEQKKRLTRLVRVEKVETCTTNKGSRKFAHTVELTTSKGAAFGRFIWEAGGKRLRDMDKWAFSPVEAYGGGSVEVPPTTACKHGKQDCPKCGTTSRRDVAHRTIKGKGAVGRIP
jgi:hypothetical protein